MRRSPFAAVVLAALASASAWAATPAQDSTRRLAAILRSSAAGLRASPDAPLLSGQLTALIGSLKALVDEKSAAPADAKPVSDEASALVGALKRGDRPAADKVLKIADDAEGLLRGGAAGGRAPQFSPSLPPSEPAALDALHGRSAAMTAIMGNTDFDGSPAASPLTGPIPLPRPRPAEADIRQPHALAYARATLYGRWEGETMNRYGQPLCYVEQFAQGKCAQISVSIDQRLQVRKGTRVESPELTAAYHEYCGSHRCVRSEPVFGIDDTGGCKAFQGDGHVDVAAVSKRTSFYRSLDRLNGAVSLSYPDGLPQDPDLNVTCGRARKHKRRKP